MTVDIGLVLGGKNAVFLVDFWGLFFILACFFVAFCAGRNM